MEIKLRYIGDDYVAYLCPRCLNGTMNWEYDKHNQPYLKCILCGSEIDYKSLRKQVKNILPNNSLSVKIDDKGTLVGK